MMSWLSQIELRNPWWLLLALQPLLLWSLAILRQRFHADEFADANLLPWAMSERRLSGQKSLLQQLSLLLAWCVFATAMAGPRIQQRVIGGNEKNDLLLQVVVDVSYSMSARDVIPTRLQRIKLELHDLIERLHKTRLGLIVYAGRAHVMVPATSDKTVLRQAVDSLRVRELPTEGSNMLDGLSLARQQITKQPNRSRAILLISDGEVSDDSAQGQQALDKLVTDFRVDNIHLYVLGVGTAQGVALLDNQNGWLRKAGRTVVTRLHAERLQKLAQIGNGKYSGVEDDDSDWQSLYDTGLARLRSDGVSGKSKQLIVWRDMSAWFVLPGIVLLLLAYIRLPAMNKAPATAMLLMMVFAIATLKPIASQASDITYPDAFSLYQNGKYQLAAKQFARIPGYRARMGEGASLYKLKKYPQAASVYIQAVLDANTDMQRANALFNLGNSYFKHADYERAARTYHDVLQYAPRMKVAKTNLLFAEALIKKAEQNPAGLTRRAGTGARMSSAAENTVVGKGRVRIDESESKTKQQPPSSDTAPGQKQDKRLAGEAKAISNKIDLDKDVTWTYDITHARDISQQDTRIEVDQSVFWKHLFETEEGFPAPRERPEVLPGVAPW